MSNYKVIGVKNVDYVSRRSGRPVKGYSLYLTYERNDVDGLACEDVYVSTERINDVPYVGDLCSVYYNRYGSVESVVIESDGEGGEKC